LLYRKEIKVEALSAYSNSKSTIASYCRKTTTTTTVATTRRPYLIEQGQQEQKQQYEIITIKDTGTEIHSEILPRLFSKFATKSNREGTGLGLYISKKHTVENYMLLTILMVKERHLPLLYHWSKSKNDKK
jgi:signal transduction histidine kinase